VKRQITSPCREVTARIPMTTAVSLRSRCEMETLMHGSEAERRRRLRRLGLTEERFTTKRQKAQSKKRRSPFCVFCTFVFFVVNLLARKNRR
jgi:hypothetical protein